MAASMSEQNKNEIELVRNFDLNLIDKEFITNPFPTCRALRNYSPCLLYTSDAADES